MLFLTSDLHADLGSYKRLLKLIDFNVGKDRMLILGDVLDRGESPISLLEFIRPMIEEGSIELLMGNHELFCIKYLEHELDERTWASFGGKKTIEELKRYNKKQKKELLEFLKALPLYKELSIDYFGGKVICTHAGLHEDFLIEEDGVIDVKKSIEVAAQRNLCGLLCGTDLYYFNMQILNRLDSFLIVGHVPTFYLRGGDTTDNKIVRTPYYMDIDGGSGKGGSICCYIIDNDTEVYLA